MKLYGEPPKKKSSLQYGGWVICRFRVWIYQDGPSPRRTGFNPTPVHVNKLTKGQILLRTLRLSLPLFYQNRTSVHSFIRSINHSTTTESYVHSNLKSNTLKKNLSKNVRTKRLIMEANTELHAFLI